MLIVWRWWQSRWTRGPCASRWWWQWHGGGQGVSKWSQWGTGGENGWYCSSEFLHTGHRKLTLDHQEMEEMFLSLVFNQIMAEKLVYDQGTYSPQTLASLSNKENMWLSGQQNTGKESQISVLAAKNLKLTVFMFKSMEHCSKTNDIRHVDSATVLESMRAETEETRWHWDTQREENVGMNIWSFYFSELEIMCSFAGDPPMKIQMGKWLDRNSTGPTWLKLQIWWKKRNQLCSWVHFNYWFISHIQIPHRLNWSKHVFQLGTKFDDEGAWCSYLWKHCMDQSWQSRVLEDYRVFQYDLVEIYNSHARFQAKCIFNAIMKSSILLESMKHGPIIKNMENVLVAIKHDNQRFKVDMILNDVILGFFYFIQ